MISQTVFPGNWEETKKKLKTKFGILTERDLRLPEGGENDLLRRLELILGNTQDELRLLITQYGTAEA